MHLITACIRLLPASLCPAMHFILCNSKFEMVSNTCNITHQVIHGYTIQRENESHEKHIFIPASRQTLIAHAFKFQNSNLKFKVHAVPISLSCVGNHTKDVKTLTLKWPSSKFKFQTSVLLHYK